MPEKDTQNTKISQENLEVQFTKTTDRVRYVFGRIEEDYATPLLVFLAETFRSRPVATTFACVFIALSFWPIVTFVGIVVGGFATLLGFGICAALAIYVLLLTFAVFIFVAILVAVLASSAFLTGVILSVYVTIHLSRRFYTLVHANGRNGITEWINETKESSKEYIRPAPISKSTPPDEAIASGSDDVPVMVD